MKKLIAVLLSVMLLLSCAALAEAPARKTDFPDNTFEEMD